ncbi:MAG: hypothetical protein P4L16_06015 [Chlamydiales bacterium]|nr:hypothetical protein [Chlamydiales bacterium]
MSSHIEAILLGHPIIATGNKIPFENQPFLKKSNSFTQLRPSSYNPYSLWGRIQRIVLYVLDFLVHFTRPSILPAIEVTSSSNAQRDDLITLYKHCLSKNGGNNSSVQQYEELLREIESIWLCTDATKIPEEKRKFCQNLVSKITNLKDKEHLVIPLTIKEETSSVYILQKNADSYSLKLIGCDDLFLQISDVSSKKIGGKEKVLSQMAFENIPSAYFTENSILELFCNPLLEGPLNAEQIKATIAKIPKNTRVDLTEKQELWVTKQSSHRKVLGLLTQEVNPKNDLSSPQIHNMRKRLEFQTRLFALFNFFKEVRFYLEDDDKYVDTLRNLVTDIAKEASLLYAKKILATEDLEQLKSELVFVEKTIEKAEAQKKLRPITSAIHTKSPNLPLSITNIQLPTERDPAIGKANSFQNPTLKPYSGHKLRATSHLLSTQERVILESSDINAIVRLLEEKSALAQRFAEQGKKSLAVALVMELTQNIKTPNSCAELYIKDLKLNTPEKDSYNLDFWFFKLSRPQVLQVQSCMVKLTKVLVENRENTPPLTNQIAVLFKLTRLYLWVLEDPSEKKTPVDSMYFGDLLTSIFHEVSIPTFQTVNKNNIAARCFYLADEENTSIIDFLNTRTKLPITPMDEKRLETLPLSNPKESKEHLELIAKFFQYHYSTANHCSLLGTNYSAYFWFFLNLKHHINDPAHFHPKNVFRSAKPIQNPLLFAALQGMRLQGEEQKQPINLKISSPFTSSEIVKDSPDERKAVKDDHGKTESIKFPEAANDDPERVFETQLTTLIDHLDRNGENCDDLLKNTTHSLKKEELTDLLLMLRLNSPQLEVIDFIIKHPHLLSSSDTRNYLEVVLFDKKGSSLLTTFGANPEFVKNLPNILEKQLCLYSEHAQKDSSYYNQILFVLSITRRMRSLYRAYNQDPQAIKKLDHLLDGFSSTSILENPELHTYRFRAVFEDIMLKIENPDNAEEVIRLYHILQVLPKEACDVDPNEMDKLSRRYAVLLHSLETSSIEQLTPLLDVICSDLGLQQGSVWTGSFPLFENSHNKVNLLNATVTEKSSGIIHSALPRDILTSSTYTLAFKEIDNDSLQIKMKVKDNLVIYYIFDKNGEQGSIEVQDGKYRFYKKFSAIEKPFQVISLAEQKNLYAPLHSLTSDLLYFSSTDPLIGLCLDSNGKTLFKLKLDTESANPSIKSLVDCRNSVDSAPYKIEYEKTLSSLGLASLTNFENESDILLLSSSNALKKVIFVRYGLSFSFKNGKLYAEDGSYQDYWIDLHLSKKYPHAIVLRHKDHAIPPKVLFADPSVFKSHITATNKEASLFEHCLLILKTWWTGKAPNPKEFVKRELVEGAVKKSVSSLTPHAFSIHPYTKKLTPLNTKKCIASAIALIKHSMVGKEYSLALQGLKQLFLNRSNLTKEQVTELFNFLREETDNIQSTAIKIQLALHLKHLIKNREAFHNLLERIDTLICEYCVEYLKIGRKLDQKLLLSRAQFASMVKIVKKKDKAFYDHNLRIFFLKENDTLPKFDTNSGTILWNDSNDIDLKSILEAEKHTGLFFIEKAPLEQLERDIGAYTKAASTIELKGQGKSLLFQDSALSSYFTASSYQLPEVTLQAPENASACEKKAVENLKHEMDHHKNIVSGRQLHSLVPKQALPLKKNIHALKASYKKEALLKKEAIQTLLESHDPVESIAIKAGLQQVASFQELTIAFMQKNLAELKTKKLLPEQCNIQELENLLKDYFSLEVQNLLLRNCSKVLKNLLNPSLNADERLIQSEILYQFLSLKRYYSITHNPELLVHECFSQQVFRSLDFEKNQVQMLHELLNHSNGIFQASTGSGKTALFSVLRGLKQANGTNLVTFRTLPTLFEQSKSILQKNLESAYEKKIYALQYNLKMSSVVKGAFKESSGTNEISLFKKIYHELLMTIHEKGCVLTDYKSFPLLQEKWIKLNRELLAKQRTNIAITPIENEHWTYLKKILLLLQEREETLMDEFDVPNRSCNRLQIQLGKPINIAPFIVDISLEIYDELKNDPRLKLSNDLQRELSEETRLNVLMDCARKFATKFANGADPSDLLKYFLGEKDMDLSSYPPSEQDMIALCKDQFYTFLPLALKKASDLDYKRSQDGKRTVPCHEGEPQENSRPGHPLEEINFTIQDYIKNGVSLPELATWIQDLQDSSIKGNSSQAQFAQIFPDDPFPRGKLKKTDLLALQKKLNNNWAHVRYFLEIKLKAMSVSGEVISMTPHDMSAMTRGVTGLSATTGCPEELPKPLQENAQKTSGVVGDMAYRLLKRAGTNDTPLVYDPENPSSILSQGNFNALIDGAGAFRSYPTEDVATSLLNAQAGRLTQVGYRNGTHHFAGASESTLSQRGFYFPKAQARGANEILDPESIALLTVDGRKTLEDLLQNDGRMRLKGQKIRLARSTLNPQMNSTENVLIHSACNEGLSHATGLFRSKMQEIPHLVRQSAYKKLLETRTLDETLLRFDNFQSLFIQEPSYDYSTPGSYHKNNHMIQRVEHRPLEVLQIKRAHWLEYARKNNLQVSSLEELSWDQDLLDKMPSQVPGNDATLLMGLEVEEEVEIEVEQEVETELVLDQCSDALFYLPWKSRHYKRYSAQELHPLFHKRLSFTENFLPIEREDKLLKRTPFDQAQPKIRILHISPSTDTVLIGDALDDVHHRPFADYPLIPTEYTTTKPAYLLDSYSRSFSYDIHTRQVVAAGKGYSDLSSFKGFYKIVAQAKFINGEYEGYSKKELNGFSEWLKEHPGELHSLQNFFENTVLHGQPQKINAFRQSPLFELFKNLNAF